MRLGAEILKMNDPKNPTVNVNIIQGVEINIRKDQ